MVERGDRPPGRRRKQAGYVIDPHLQRQLPGFADEGDPVQAYHDEEQAQRLREALAAYNLDANDLRRLVEAGEDLMTALRGGNAPEELVNLLRLFNHLIRPRPREQIRSPSDAAAILMVEMGHLDQEQMRVVCLDTKNRVQSIPMVYQGSLNSSMVRVAEIFKDAVRLNSAAIIPAHNHPSGDPTPSPEDVFVTREIVQAGRLLDVDVLDHIVIAQGRWLSMRERGLGFSE